MALCTLMLSLLQFQLTFRLALFKLRLALSKLRFSLLSFQPGFKSFQGYASRFQVGWKSLFTKCKSFLHTKRN